MKKRIVTLLLMMMVCVMVLGSFGVFAVNPYDTYTYSMDGYALKSPDAYTPVMTIGYRDIETSAIKLGEFNTPTDLVADDDGTVYLADSKNNRVIAMRGQDYKVKFTLSTFDNNGYADSFNECRGVFVDDNYIYVCDTNNSRIVVFNKNGTFEKIIGKPTGTLFGASTQYNPIAMAVDQYGRIFVISSTTYEGVIVMTSDGVFTGYIGAQKGTYSPLQIILRRFQTKKQREASALITSTEFNNITIDEDGFIYVTTNTIDKNNQQTAITSKEPDYAPVKKLNSSGAEIMKRNGFFAPGGEVDVLSFSSDPNAKLGASSITDAAIGDEGTWSIVDKLRSKIFTYDQNGVLLFAFGDAGNQLGNAKTISSITYQQDKLLVLDQDANTFTVYRRTPYGQLLIDALACENRREYAASIDAWLSVLQYNNNFDSAYVGVGRAYYRQGNSYFVSEDGQSYHKQSDVAVYDESGAIVGYALNGVELEIDPENPGYIKRGYELAMEYLSAAYDADNWSNAYKEIRKEWIAKWIALIPIIVVAIVVLWSFLMKKAAKYNAKVALTGVGRKKYGQELVYVFHLMFHPFDGFWDLKHERRGSVRGALTILGIVILSFYYQSIGTGYIMNTTGDYSTIVVQFLSVALPLILWVISNWCLTTLFEGEGSFKDVFIATSYALSPLPLILVISTIMSNFVTAEEASIVSMLVVIGYVWAGLLIFFGMMVTHDYSFGKNFIMCICTIVGMAVIMFVGFLFSSLVGKMVSFVSSIISEISYRM